MAVTNPQLNNNKSIKEIYNEHIKFIAVYNTKSTFMD